MATRSEDCGAKKSGVISVPASTSCVGLDKPPNFSGLHQFSKSDNSSSFLGLLQEYLSYCVQRL